jgi:hypothetical protein
MGLLWNLLPDSAMPLVIAAGALLLIVGVISRRKAVAVVGGVVACLIMGPFIDMVFGFLPWWVSPLLLVVLVVSIFRFALSLILGQHAADHAVGILAADVIRNVFQLLLFPFRIMARLRRPH